MSRTMPSEEEQPQRELFEFEAGPKKRFPYLGNIFKKNDFENRYMVTMSPERMVFLGIGFVMVLVLIYALGVERGRSAARTRVITAKTEIVSEKTQTATGEQIQAPALPTQQAARTPAQQDAPAQPAAPEQAVLDKFYTIIACTFTKDGTASAGAERLKTEGLDAFVYQSDSYYQVCVGRFADTAGAREALTKVRRYFKDAYIIYRQ